MVGDQPVGGFDEPNERWVSQEARQPAPADTFQDEERCPPGAQEATVRREDVRRLGAGSKQLGRHRR